MDENPIRIAGKPAEAAADGSALRLPAAAADTDAFWRGYHAALAAQAAPDDDSSPRVRRTRVDGFDGARQVVFLEGIAEGLTVAAAAGRAGISVTAVYNFRDRRAGRAFNLAWEAASCRARRPLADRLHDRSLEGQTETIRDKDGEMVGTRHRHDNRLAMAMLTRLDRKAEASQEDERLVTILAEEFEELLDCIEEGGDAQAFIDERRPSDAPPAEREREALRRRYEGVDPADIDISDLDFDERHEWTADQRWRAEKAGFFKRYWDAWEAPGGPKDDEWKLPAAYRDALRLRDHG